MLLCALALLRAFATRERIWLFAAAGTALLALCGYRIQCVAAAQAVPGAGQRGDAAACSRLSLRLPPTVVERLARLQEPDLPPDSGGLHAARHADVVRLLHPQWRHRAVITALWSSERVWALYNGLIAYVLMGTLFAGEWLVRQRVKARRHG